MLENNEAQLIRTLILRVSSLVDNMSPRWRTVLRSRSKMRGASARTEVLSAEEEPSKDVLECEIQ